MLARNEIPLSHDALIVGNYKLLWSEVVHEAGWSGPSYPNASSTTADVQGASLKCGFGCLFDIAHDPGEHQDLAGAEQNIVAQMKSRLIELRGSFFENDDRGIDSCPAGIDMPCACWMAVNYYGGFFGPYQEVHVEHSSQKDEALAVLEAVEIESSMTDLMV